MAPADKRSVAMNPEADKRHDHFMRLALEEARRAGEDGDIPVGCVIVHADEVIAQAGNDIQRSGDPTRHAEHIAITEAVRTVGKKFLSDCTLYVTLEPCAMCAGAMVLARIPTVVYGAADEKTGAVRSVFEILDDQRMNHRCIVRSGVLAQESSALLSAFFSTLRSTNAAMKDEGKLRSEPPAAAPNKHTATATATAQPLMLVPTPIGNIEDITVRGLKTLKEADVIVCEDTRHTGQLLRRYGIHAPRLLSNHEHNERERADEIVRLCQTGKRVALVSDAGIPGVNDPGNRAVSACISSGVNVIALPGASAGITAVVASGLPTDALYFGGFPPQKKGRTAWIERVLREQATIILYESPHRLLSLLESITEIGGGMRPVVVARELTKIHEEYIRGTAAEVLEVVTRRGGVKGECVVLVGGARVEA